MHRCEAKGGRARHAQAAKRATRSVRVTDPGSAASHSDSSTTTCCSNRGSLTGKITAESPPCQHVASMRGDAQVSASVHSTAGMVCNVAAHVQQWQGSSSKLGRHVLLARRALVKHT